MCVARAQDSLWELCGHEMLVALVRMVCVLTLEGDLSLYGGPDLMRMNGTVSNLRGETNSRFGLSFSAF